MPSPDEKSKGYELSRGEVVRAIFVPKQYAKAAKKILESANVLHRDFRMVPAITSSSSTTTTTTTTTTTNTNTATTNNTTTTSADGDMINNGVNGSLPIDKCIALPIVDGFRWNDKTKMKKEQKDVRHNDDDDQKHKQEQEQEQIQEKLIRECFVVGMGIQFCPYSSSMLGNHNRRKYLRRGGKKVNEGCENPQNNIPKSNDDGNRKKGNGENDKYIKNQLSTLCQQAILQTVQKLLKQQTNKSIILTKRISTTTTTYAAARQQQDFDVDDSNVLQLDDVEEEGRDRDHENEKEKEIILLVVDKIKQLSTTECPKKLEYFGDDRTLVIPPHAFTSRSFFDIFRPVQEGKGEILQQETTNDGDNTTEDCYFNRNDNEPLNEEDHHHEAGTIIKGKQQHLQQQYQRLFWEQLAILHDSPRVVRRGMIDPNSRVRESGHRLLYPYEGIPEATGPNSDGWITVTEQGIKQSFDMTRVMFSRGNITEKIRFGKSLVHPNEIILDMYAGIGYYTLPALIHGKALHVYACEWNENAIMALRYNIQNNRISTNKVTIFHGDCRTSVEENKDLLFGKCHRISLGLLPSSQGGWKVALQTLHYVTGGWLHIHGNVPIKEVNIWSTWVCYQLDQLLLSLQQERQQQQQQQRTKVDDFEKEEQQQGQGQERHRKLQHNKGLQQEQRKEELNDKQQLNRNENHDDDVDHQKNDDDDEEEEDLDVNNKNTKKNTDTIPAPAPAATNEKWIIVCDHVEKVKSFAPTVAHYVADIFVGPRWIYNDHDDRRRRSGGGGVVDKGNNVRSHDSGGNEVDDGSGSDYDSSGTSTSRRMIYIRQQGNPSKLVLCTTHVDDIPTPSCALSPDGVLSQEWMM